MNATVLFSTSTQNLANISSINSPAEGILVPTCPADYAFVTNPPA